MYPKHEYSYPCVGEFKKKKEIFNAVDEPGQLNKHISLSYFSRPKHTKTTTKFHESH